MKVDNNIKIVISEKIKKDLKLTSTKDLTTEKIVKAIKKSGNSKYCVVQEGNTVKVGILTLG